MRTELQKFMPQRAADMNSLIIRQLQKPMPRLIYSLICGIAYFVIIMSLISGYTAYSQLMGIFIAPLVICGGAYLVVRLLRAAFEENDKINKKSVYATFYMNLIIMVIAVLTIAVR